MCGIIGYIGEGSTADILLSGLRSLEYRGYDSAGIAIVGPDGMNLLRSEGKLDNLERELATTSLSGSFGVGHTRWATHGRPNEENAHPHRDCAGKIVVVHNGIVENYLTLKKELSDQGHKFVTETDTEIIAHTIEKYFEGDLESAVRNALKDLEGVFAFVALSADETDVLVGARNGPPLVLGIGDGESFIASDIPAFLKHTRSAVFLEDGDVVILRAGEVKVVDIDGNALERQPEQITWDPIQVEKQGFEHFMLKEIFEQPQAVRETLVGRYSLDSGLIHLNELELTNQFISSLTRISIAACGTSWLAAQIGKFYIEQLARLPVDVDIASEFRYRNPILDKTQLVVGITQSGETADTLGALKVAAETEATTLALCNVVSSMATRVCDETLYTHAGPEIGVAATKTFTSQVVLLYLLALHLAQRRGHLSPEEGRNQLTELARTPHIMEQVLHDVTPSITDIAQEFYGFDSFLFLGRGHLYPIALEGALKLKELSYIHAEGYPAGEMKHGPIALIDDRMPLVALALDNSLFEKMANNIQEAKARGARIIAITTAGDDRLPPVLDPERDRIIELPQHPEATSPLVSVLPLQLLAYHIALCRGCNVDQPRNLAKSVTVE